MCSGVVVSIPNLLYPLESCRYRAMDAICSIECQSQVPNTTGKEFANKAQLETQTMFEKVKEAFDPMQGLRGTEMKVGLVE